MPDLERELRALGAVLDLPAERDLAPAVLARLGKPTHAGRWLRLAGVAALVLVIGLAATMAVPDARTAVLRFLGLKGVTVIRVDELPPASTKPHLFGESVTLAEAERVVGFRPLLPSDLDPPDGIRINRFSPYFVVLLYGRPDVRLRLTETNGGVIEKQVQIDQRVERVEVDGQPGHLVGGPACRHRAVRNAEAVREHSALGAGRPDVAARGTVHQGAGARARPHGSLSSVREQRGQSRCWEANPRLGSVRECHPARARRGFLAAETVRRITQWFLPLGRS